MPDMRSPWAVRGRSAVGFDVCSHLCDGVALGGVTRDGYETMGWARGLSRWYKHTQSERAIKPPGLRESCPEAETPTLAPAK